MERDTVPFTVYNSPTGKEAYDQLVRAVLDYLSEIDNPVPDATMRMILRDRLRAMTGAPDDPRLRSFVNLNTPEQLEQVRALIGQQASQLQGV